MKSLRPTPKGPSTNWYKAPDLNKEEDIDLEERWVLQCLMRGITGTGTLSTISIKKICSWCSYTDNDGIYHPYGKDWINEKIQHLANVGRIIINKGPRGKCTTYTINGLDKFKQIPDALYYIPLSPAQKGFIIFLLQYNVNNWRKNNGMTYDANIVECDFQDLELQDRTHVKPIELKKLENSLVPFGFYNVVPTTKHHNLDKGGVAIISRQLNLDKLNAFMAICTNTGKQIDDIYDTLDEIQQGQLTKEDVKKIIAETIKEFSFTSDEK